MKNFNRLFSSIIEETVAVSNLSELISKSDKILYETATVLPCPEKLVKIVKSTVETLIKNNDEISEVKIPLCEALSDNFLNTFNDSNLTHVLTELFKNHKSAFFTVKIELPKYCFSEKYGEYILPIDFVESIIDIDTLHYDLPRIKPLKMKNELTQNIQTEFKKEANQLLSIYETKQKVLKIFKQEFLKHNNFGTIVIYPFNCTTDTGNVNLPLLEEAIEHECQHLCIFLLSLAKTCVWFGLHFSNNLNKAKSTYQLKESEFITLFNSYSSILKRIYQKIEEPKNLNEFIHTLIELSINNSSNYPQKYIQALTESAQFSRIKQFIFSIFSDSNTIVNVREFDKNSSKIVKTPIVKIGNDKKFKTLMKWLVKAISE